jgi:hypothetical protein
MHVHYCKWVIGILFADIMSIWKKQKACAFCDLYGLFTRDYAPLSVRNEPNIKIIKTFCVPTPIFAAFGNAA